MMWWTAGAVALLPLIGYLLSRSVGLPQLEDHVGDWLNPAGVASLVCEAVLVVLSATRLWRRDGESRGGAAAARGT